MQILITNLYVPFHNMPYTTFRNLFHSINTVRKKTIFKIHGVHHPADRDPGMQVQGVPAHIGAKHIA